MLRTPLRSLAVLPTQGAVGKSSHQHEQQEAEYRTDAAAGGHTPEAGRCSDRAHVNDEGGHSSVAAVPGLVLSGVQLLRARIG